MTFSDRLKNSFVAGLILVAPLAVTLFVLRVLVNWALQFVNPIVARTGLIQHTANIELAAQLITATLIVVAIVLIGFLAQVSVARQLFGNVGRIVNVIPLVNTLYTNSRQIINALVDRETKYESVVLVEYPRTGLYSLGLVTAQSPDQIEAVTDEATYNVFLPNSPNPTAGRLVLVPESQLREIDMSVRQGMRMIVTTGMGDDGAYAHLTNSADEVGPHRASESQGTASQRS
jgi:uncharacterized membrane protein